MKEYPEWLRRAARKGGKTSKRKLSKREARRIASAGWEGVVGEARRAKLRAKTHNDSLPDNPGEKPATPRVSKKGK